MYMIKHLIVSGFLALLLAGCGGGGSGTPAPAPPGDPDPVPIGIGDLLIPQPGEGFAQKGPFQTNSAVTAVELDMENNGQPTGNTWSTQTDGDGLISFNGIDWAGVAMVTVEGSFFNEVTGEFSATPMRLRAVMEVGEASPPANVNLFTHLAARYIEYWVEEGFDYEEYRDWAHWFFEEWFDLKTTPDQLNILDNRGFLVNNESKVLLLYSAAAASLGLTQEQLDTLADDFARYDGGWADEAGNELDSPVWPPGTGFDLLLALFEEVDQNGEALYELARNNLMAEYGRFFTATDWGGSRAYGGYCGFAQVLCNDTFLEGIPILTSVGRDIPVRFGLPGSYGITVTHPNTSQLSFSFLNAAGTGTPLHSWGSVGNSFSEQVIGARPGNTDWLLRIGSGVDIVLNSVFMQRLSDGLPSEPVPLVSGVNTGYGGVVWGGVDNTSSYYQLMVPAGTWTVSISGFPCGASEVTPISVRGYHWDYDMSEPLPEEAVGLNPFENNGELQHSNTDIDGCFEQFTLISPGTQPNRLYLWIKAEGIRDININSNRPIRHEYTITVNAD